MWLYILIPSCLLCASLEAYDRKGGANMTCQRLTTLRALMAANPTALAAYIVPTADAHNSEYIAPVDARREWISGFTGSAGTAVVTTKEALMWTDGRYYTQFLNEADTTRWTLMKQSLPETPSIEKWLSTHLAEGSAVGVDPETMTREEWSPIQSLLAKSNMVLLPVPKNLVDEARVQLNDPPPPRPSNTIMPLPLKFTGRQAQDKIGELRKKMAEKKAVALIVTALDEIAYILNLRGSDIQYNPVFFSYLIIRETQVVLFVGDGSLPPEVVSQLGQEGVQHEQRPYKEIYTYLENMAKDISNSNCTKCYIWLSSDASEAIHRAAAGVSVQVKLESGKKLGLLSEVSPVALMKLQKNAVELEGFRECHVRDGVALVRFFRWLHEVVDRGETVTEIQAADKLLELRKDEANFMGPSFETIAGSGANGAIIHYSPSREGPQKVILKDDMFLLDSGGQYKDGTTDVTRTRHMGRKPTQEQKTTFTLVLKGQMAIGSTLFPQGVKGNVLDSFARRPLWNVGLDYGHGTGHGVGHFLNVHEGPSGVSWRPYPHDPGLRPHQILSNEPGFYRVGAYGIRHEDLVETVAITKDSDHPRAASLLGDYEGRGVLGFNTLTMAPHQRACIDETLLDDFEINYLNAYHARVLRTLGPILQNRGLQADYRWLEEECAPILKK